MTETLITVVISGLLSIIGSLIAVSVAWKKAPADTAAVYQEIANKQGKANENLIARIDKLEKQVDDLECQLMLRDRLIAEWQVGITRLIEQLEEHKLAPVWRPKAQKKVANETT